MRLKTFCEGLVCHKKGIFRRVRTCETETLRRQILMGASSLIPDYIKSGEKSVFYIHFKEAYRELYSVPMQLEEACRRDSLLWKRLLDYYLNDKPVIVEHNKVVVTIYGTILVHMVYEQEGQYHALIIESSKQKLSKRGRKITTRPESSVLMAAIKEAMEEAYKGITIHLASLPSKKDKNGVIIPLYDKADEVSYDFKEQYTSPEEFRAYLEGLTNAFALEEADCSTCIYNGKYCNLQPFRKSGEVEEKAGETRTFTDSQQEAIGHLFGPMRISAGPGSGKTAVLVERLRVMIEEKGVSPFNILMVTFTKSAAAEMEKRLLPIVGERCLPTISTLHALALNVLGASEIGRRSETKVARYKLLKLAVMSLPEPFKGASTLTLYGEFGLLPRLETAFEDLKDPEAFERKYPSFDYEQVQMVYRLYQEMYEELGYITFDDQISLACEMLESDKYLLRSFRARYKYIMVDEFQDVDGEQMRLISLLAGDKGNLTVVGDDDQAIYSFRGGSNEYMLSFPEAFPGCREVELSDNFRSTHEIIACNRALIEKNVERIPKNFRGRKDGKRPVFLNIFHMDSMPKLVGELREHGYRYGDIAIISRNNGVLYKIKNMLGDNAIMSKSYLYNDHVFLTILYLIRLSICPAEEKDGWLTKIMSLHGIIPGEDYGEGESLYQYMASRKDDMEVVAFMEKLSDVLLYLKEPEAQVSATSIEDEAVKQIEGIQERVANIFINWYQLNEHPAMDAMFELISNEAFSTLEQLVSYMEYMALVEDDGQRVTYVNEDKISLITAHDSKGHEYKVVILVGLDDFNPRNEFDAEEARRLLYVAQTRAEERLFICAGGTTSRVDVNGSAFISDYLSECQIVREY